MRQRPFDEALPAELERMSQNLRTCSSQLSSSSSSSQNWWQHEDEHQDSQWRGHEITNDKIINGEIINGKITNGEIINGEFADFCFQKSRVQTLSNVVHATGVKTEHLVFCLVSGPHLIALFTRTCVRLAQDMIGTCCIPALFLKCHPISQHASQNAPRHDHFVPRHHRRHLIHCT